MPMKNETSTRLMDEMRSLSPWAYAFAVLGSLCGVAAFVFVAVTHQEPFPLPFLVLLTILGGAMMGCYFLLIGYINADAGRRGMSRLAWTLIAIFVPHALGIVLYFVLRKPRTLTCPQCSAAVEPGFGFCPECRSPLHAVCPHCQRGVNAAAKFCPYCGGDLANRGANPSNPVSIPS